MGIRAHGVMVGGPSSQACAAPHPSPPLVCKRGPFTCVCMYSMLAVGGTRVNVGV